MFIAAVKLLASVPVFSKMKFYWNFGKAPAMGEKREASWYFDPSLLKEIRGVLQNISFFNPLYLLPQFFSLYVPFFIFKGYTKLTSFGLYK